MTDYVLTGLVKRRADLLAEAKAAQATLTRLLSDIEYLDGAIRQFSPGYRPQPIQLTRAERTGASRTMLGVLRTAAAPMTVRQIALRVMAEQGKDAGNAKLVKGTMSQMRKALARLAKNGLARVGELPDRTVVWEVAR